MQKKYKTYIGNSASENVQKKITGEIIDHDGVGFYKISNYDKMPPFLMSLVGAGNHWMFISSNGALTAGRREPTNALFPYTTDDKITDSADVTGSKSIFRIRLEEKEFLWEPFSSRYEGLYNAERNIYKSIFGNILIFEEINYTLGITFSYQWQFSNAFGFVKTSKLRNMKKTDQEITLLDGIQNILPYGVDEGMQMRYSTLVDAYKKNELDVSSGMGIYYLSSIPTDRAEPSEGLKSTTIWTVGLEKTKKLLSSDQVKAFRFGEEIIQEENIRGRRGAYFVSKKAIIKSSEELSWMTVAELEQDLVAIHQLQNQLKSSSQLMTGLVSDLELGTKQLVELVAMADGLQLVEDDLVSTRHFSNVLFNVMRGGIFQNHYKINRTKLTEYLYHFNKKIAELVKDKIIFTLPEEIEYGDLISFAEDIGNADILRLCSEYLPLSFGRRHGDPSRPWNKFYIQNFNDDGSREIDYQGNWRDIFQNWEALAFSYPEFAESMICRFLNASTADGYNPYRITKDGIDWEEIDPDDPWSNIGYWGDHQIIYLLKLLELSENFHPDRLVKWLSEDMFVYSNVPYRIKNYPEKLEDPRNTILFDKEEADKISRCVMQNGADGKLIWLNGETYKVNMTEKLLVPLLAKLSNFVADGGIWLCNQRPEWNDANNAMVGNGLSMVTVYHLRRHIAFLQNLFCKIENDSVAISEEVSGWIKNTYRIFSDNQIILENMINSSPRRKLLDALGYAVDKYQTSIYRKGFKGKKSSLKIKELTDFLSLVLQYIDSTIAHNQREDKLFHSYNLMRLEEDGGISIVNLHEMLEGQVAILNSGVLDGKQSLDVLDALKNSDMYSSDQKSYTLYPNRNLPRFLEKNRVPLSDISSLVLVNECLKRKDFRILKPLDYDTFQFNGAFKNSKDLVSMLEELRPDYDNDIIDREKKLIVRLFEDTFNHHSFTGRSGTFFKYEGLGSIYWHMVAKLNLAVQEAYFWAVENGESGSVLKRLADCYNEVKEGMGLHKNPADYGAFPTDPYSHTPQHCGVQQPGMTGQVKEDILSRWGELGICIENGRIHFKPSLLKKEEFLSSSATFHYYVINGLKKALQIAENTVVFSYCQIPVLYKLRDRNEVSVYFNAGTVLTEKKLELSQEISKEIFRRTGKIDRIEIYLKKYLVYS